MLRGLAVPECRVGVSVGSLSKLGGFAKEAQLPDSTYPEQQWEALPYIVDLQRVMT